MRKIALGISAAAMVLGGCASPQPTTITPYSYVSEQHSGTVMVQETIAAGAYHCEADWREGAQYLPSGIPGQFSYQLDVTILAEQDGKPGEDISVLVPAHSSNPVFVKDFQKTASWMLGAESNGIVSQGDLFYYPEGYVVRARNLSIKDNDFRLCLGIDRMYVPGDITAGAEEPLVHLNRLTIPFVGRSGQTYRYTLEGSEPVSLLVKVSAK